MLPLVGFLPPEEEQQQRKKCDNRWFRFLNVTDPLLKICLLSNYDYQAFLSALPETKHLNKVDERRLWPGFKKALHLISKNGSTSPHVASFVPTFCHQPFPHSAFVWASSLSKHPWVPLILIKVKLTATEQGDETKEINLNSLISDGNCNMSWTLTAARFIWGRLRVFPWNLWLEYVAPLYPKPDECHLDLPR